MPENRIMCVIEAALPYSFIFLIFSSVSRIIGIGIWLTGISIAATVVVLGHLGGFVQLFIGETYCIQVFGKDLLNHWINVNTIF
jgi:hypothetical protein